MQQNSGIPPGSVRLENSSTTTDRINHHNQCTNFYIRHKEQANTGLNRLLDRDKFPDRICPTNFRTGFVQQIFVHIAKSFNFFCKRKKHII